MRILTRHGLSLHDWRSLTDEDRDIYMAWDARLLQEISDMARRNQRTDENSGAVTVPAEVSMLSFRGLWGI